jgi:dihydroorotate dehydrogenase
VYRVFRSLLFRLDPEVAHHLTLQLIRIVGLLPPVGSLVRAMFAGPDHPVHAFGLSFVNPVGLAAGYDKDALGWRGLAYLGFGHIEIGTVTPLPQPGNPKPRLFRLPEDRALINRMGFPGRGARFAAQEMQGVRPQGIRLGVNLGKNKDTPLERAAEDYLAMLPVFTPVADYLAINISSPNTVGLRRLQGRQALEDLMKSVIPTARQEAAKVGREVPILVKLAPDLSDLELDDALDVLLASGVDGVIATNTTTAREGVKSRLAGESGGLSGEPLSIHSTAMISAIVRRTGGALPVIGVGGIMGADEAQAKLDAGASLV